MRLQYGEGQVLQYCTIGLFFGRVTILISHEFGTFNTSHADVQPPPKSRPFPGLQY